eukprot:c13524_g1_i1 orf=389-2593(-)
MWVSMIPLHCLPVLFTIFTFASSLSVDGIALLAFKEGVLEDPFGALANWDETDDTPCHWNGVSCVTLPDNPVPRVVSLNIISKNISGTIPPQLGALDYLHRLSLHDNFLNGTLPPELFNVSGLHSIFLGSNRITGFIPPEIHRLGTLENLDLSRNLFLGLIPESITSCRHLQRIILANNYFSGPIPDGIGTNLTNLEQLDLSSNLLFGTIPEDLGNLSSLQGTLNLSYNHLSGPIPSSLGSLPYTVSLDLSHNNLSGRIPQDGSLADQGPGPFLGNVGLCGLPLDNACPFTPSVSPLPSLPTEGSPPKGPSQTNFENTGTAKKPNLGTGAIVAIAVGDAVGISIVGLLFLYLYWKTTMCQDKCCDCIAKDTKGGSGQCFRASSEESEGSSEKMQEQGDLVPLDKGFSFDLEELLRASAYVLGKSGLGIVYKVVLGNGLPVAVRRLGEGGSQRFKEFEAEVQAIGRLRHPNIVQLRAYYWADDEKLLIYDYIPNSNLAAALHGHSQSPSRALSWPGRLKIIQGAARGLAYLHECSPRKYVHGDIKATKILLDTTMQAHIADFGLGRLVSIAGSGVTPVFPGSVGPDHLGSKVSMEKDAGAAGVGSSFDWQVGGGRFRNSSSFYKAPESKTDPKPTQKWDVYSFGVVLLELLSGRSPAFQIASFGVDLVTWIRKAFEEEKPLQQILDPALVADSSPEKDIVAVFQIALGCTSVSPDQRPKMKSVSEYLDKIGPQQS